MKTSRFLLVAGLLAMASSFAYAGPGPQYWQQRRAEHANNSSAVSAKAVETSIACCRIVTVKRPLSSHKVSMPEKTVKCVGCPTMAAGQKCSSS